MNLFHLYINIFYFNLFDFHFADEIRLTEFCLIPKLCESMYCRVAKYQEANPGVFTIVTFPFLFAVMFGDWGHGICLLLATLFFIIREKKLSNQVTSL